MSNKYYPAFLLEIFHPYPSAWLFKQLYAITSCRYFQTYLSVSYWGIQGMGSPHKHKHGTHGGGTGGAGSPPKAVGSFWKHLQAVTMTMTTQCVWTWDSLSLGKGAVYKATNLALTDYANSASPSFWVRDFTRERVP